MLQVSQTLTFSCGRSIYMIRSVQVLVNGNSRMFLMRFTTVLAPLKSAGASMISCQKAFFSATCASSQLPGGPGEVGGSDVRPRVGDSKGQERVRVSARR